MSGGAKNTLHSVERGAETVKEELSGGPSQNVLANFLSRLDSLESVIGLKEATQWSLCLELSEAKPCGLQSRTHAFCSGMGPPRQPQMCPLQLHFEQLFTPCKLSYSCPREKPFP